MKFKTIIVDDEPDAVNFIRSIIEEYCHRLEVVGKAYSAKDGAKAILAKNPDILLVDEPTGQLDQKTGEKIVALIQRIAKEIQRRY